MIEKKTKDFFMLPYTSLDRNWKVFSRNFDHKEIDRLKNAATLSWPPETVLIDISTVCNLDCPFCFNHYGSKISIFEKKRNSKEDIIDFVKKNGPFKNLAFSGAGELFLYSDAFEILEELEEFCEGFYISTNAQMLDEEKIKRLSKLKIKSITISSDASDKKSYEIFRKNGNYDKFLDNLKLMYKLFGSRLSIMSVVFKQNTDSLLKFPKLLHDMDIKNLSLQIVKGIAHPNLDPSVCTSMSDKDMLIFIEELYEESLLYGCNMTFSSSSFPKDKLSKKLKQYKDLYTSYCIQPFNHFQVNIDGEVNYCCGGFQTLPKNAFKGHPKVCWNDEEALKLRIMMASGYNIGACKILCNKDLNFKVMNVDIIENRLKNVFKYGFDEIIKIENVISFLKRNDYYKNLKIAVYGVGNFTKSLFREIGKDLSHIELFFDDSSYGEMINNKKVEKFDKSKIAEYDIDIVIIITSFYEESIESKIASQCDTRIVKLISESNQISEKN